MNTLRAALISDLPQPHQRTAWSAAEVFDDSKYATLEQMMDVFREEPTGKVLDKGMKALATYCKNEEVDMLLFE